MLIIRFKGLMNLLETLDNKFVMVTGEKMESTANDDKAFTEQFTCQGKYIILESMNNDLFYLNHCKAYSELLNMG